MKHLITNLITCMITLLLLFGTSAALAENAQIGLVLMQYGGNVRAQADSDSPIVGKAAANMYYGCYGNADGWYLIKLDSSTMGYVSEKRGTFFSTVAPGSQDGLSLLENPQHPFAPGDIVHFGTYEQDHDPDTTSEPLEWIILDHDQEKGQLFLITRYAVERQHYHTSNTSTTWEKSGLRAWLNSTFLETAFSEAERSLIIHSDVPADQNFDFPTTSGEATTDFVFLLSMSEADTYLSPEMRLCIPTAYVIVRGGYSDAETSACWWWLRTPGHNRMHTAYVNWEGKISGKGYGVIANKGAVRPAIRIDLNLLK